MKRSLSPAAEFIEEVLSRFKGSSFERVQASGSGASVSGVGRAAAGELTSRDAPVVALASLRDTLEDPPARPILRRSQVMLRRSRLI